MHALTIITKLTLLQGKETHLAELYHRRGWGLVDAAVPLPLLMLNDVVVLPMWEGWKLEGVKFVGFCGGGKTDCFRRR